jgi:hypothetical protein
VSFGPLRRRRARLINSRPYTPSGGAARPPVVGSIAMTVGQSTGSSVDRDSTTASRLRPGPPKRHCRPTGGRGARHIQETSDPGGLKSHGLWLHCRRAVSESICPVERMAGSRPGRAQCRCREDRAPPESGVDRNEALCRLTATDDTLTTTRRGPSLSRTQPFPKKGCICSADIRIPGPNAPVAAALTPTHRPRRLSCLAASSVTYRHRRTSPTVRHRMKVSR